MTTEEARESYRHLVNALGDTAPGPHPLRVPPSPEVLARTPYWSFHRFGVERRRADVIIRAARYEVSRPPFITSPNDLSVVANDPTRKTLTLTSCHPKGSASHRIVVRATFAKGSQTTA